MRTTTDGLNAEVRPLRTRPYPHVARDGFIDGDLYRQLAGSFPACRASSGPTGWSLYWGDPEYDDLIGRDGPWARLFRAFHSQEFVDYCLAQFAPIFERYGSIDLSRARYVPYRESREDKERRHIRSVQHSPDELWVRMDIHQGMIGYKRVPHVDHRRRLVSMLIYFCDQREIGMAGGELVLLPRRRAILPWEPLTISPAHNRMAAFACAPRSWHLVPEITAQKSPRNFIQVALSSSVDAWRE
jgi:hypothetical protein